MSLKRVSAIFLVFLLFCLHVAKAQHTARLDSMLSLTATSKNDTTTLTLFTNISAEYYSLSDATNAEVYAAKAKTLLEKLLAKTKDEQQVKWLKTKQGILLLQTGRVFHLRGNYAEELRCYLMALKLFEDLSFTNGLASAYNNIGNVYVFQGNYEEALKNQLQALKMNEIAGNKKAIATSNSNIGATYIYMGKYDEALKHLYLSIKLRQELDDKKGIADVYNNIGSIQQKQGNSSEALKSQQQAMKIREELGNKQGIAASYCNIGELYIDMGRYPEAVEWLKKALNIAIEINDKETLKDTYAYLARVYKKLNNYKAALEYQDMSVAIKDSLMNEESERQIAEMKTKYETEKKDNEIELLNKNNEIKSVKIEKQRATVRYIVGGFLLLIVFASIAFRLYNQKRKTAFSQQVAETEMKALLSQIDSHFISNTLVSIKQYLNNNDKQSSIAVTDKFSFLMREVLANSRKKEISLKEETDMLSDYLYIQKGNYKNIFDFKINLAQDIEPEEIYIPPMIVQPFVENSIKHGFAETKEGGMINIDVRKENSLLVCTITDNGMGREKASMRAEVKAYGEGLGMEVIRERMVILNMKAKERARFVYEDVKDGANNISGTRVHLYIPYTS